MWPAPFQRADFRRGARIFAAQFFARLDMERLKALAAITWGGWSIACDSFDVSPSFRALIVSAAPLTGEAHAEWLWGGLTMLAGLLQLYGLWSGRRGPRMVGALFAGTMWLFLALCFLISNARSTAWVLQAQMALACFALYFQIGTGRRA